MRAVPQRWAGSAGSVLGGVERGSVRSLYVHVPFCTHKCHYCDFYSVVDRRGRAGAFVERLVRELEAISPWAGPLETVFVGGGTPSLLGAGLWERLLRAFGDLFDLGAVRDGGGEFTVECNPETVTGDLMAVLRVGGVNRVSMGAQSFDPALLACLERTHDPERVAGAVEAARRAGIGRVSVDLIYAIPGQTIDGWRRDLECALGLGTEHLSCYNLTYEPNTAMTARLARGEFEAVGEEDEIAMFEEATRAAREAGLVRYEVSNYARRGCECRHNLVYWRCGSWLAAGPSAAGHAGGHRWKNVPRLEDYLEWSDGGFAPIAEHEGPDPARSLRERIMLGLRLAEGIDAEAVVREAWALDESWGAGLEAAMERAVRDGLAQRDGERVTLTERGVLLADAIASEWMTAGRGSV